jgi:hypothetical protein
MEVVATKSIKARLSRAGFKFENALDCDCDGSRRMCKRIFKDFIFEFLTGSTRQQSSFEDKTEKCLQWNPNAQHYKTF